MSVNQDSLPNGNLVTNGDAPELEYVAVKQDSLSMMGAALGGAILGMLMTLLVLAILNSGTLRFVGGASRLAQVETAYNQLSANVGTNTTNIDTLDSNMEQQVQMLEGKIGQQDASMGDINTAVADLDVSRGQFDTLVDALSGAISSITGAAAPTEVNATEAEAAPAAEGEASTEAGSTASAGSLSVLFFADGNANHELDAGEESLLGIHVALINADGESVATLESTDGGMQFDGVAPGEYTLMVEDAGEYTLASNELGTVAVEEGGEQAVFIAVASE